MLIIRSIPEHKDQWITVESVERMWPGKWTKRNMIEVAVENINKLLDRELFISKDMQDIRKDIEKLTEELDDGVKWWRAESPYDGRPFCDERGAAIMGDKAPKLRELQIEQEHKRQMWMEIKSRIKMLLEIITMSHLTVNYSREDKDGELVRGNIEGLY